MLGRKHTDDEVAARRSEVETVISTGRWSRDEVRALAKKHGVDTREIYRDRTAVLDEIREAISDPDPANAKLDLLMRARDLYRTCAAVQENRSTAAKLLDFEARVLGAFEPLKVDVRHTIERLPDEDLARQILDPEAVRWARAVLEAAGEPVPGVLDVVHSPARIEQDP